MNLFNKCASCVLGIVMLTSCASSKSYFTSDVRTRIEKNGISVEKLQFFVDRDVELRREVSSRDAKVTSGKVKLVNGHYLNIIDLKRNTPGVCTGFYSNSLNVTFESGDGQYLSFGVPTYGTTNIYQILAQDWTNGGRGKVIYEGNTYFIQPKGVEARLLIDKSVIDKMQVKKRTMQGRTVDTQGSQGS
jgi:hypothetical protein